MPPDDCVRGQVERMKLKCLCAAAACCFGIAPAALAQTTGKDRETAPRPVQFPQAPRTDAHTVNPTAAEATPFEQDTGSETRSEQTFLEGLLSSINRVDEGWSPRVGSVVSGGGLAIGSHYRESLASSRLFLDTEYLASVKGYQSALLEISSRPFARGKLRVGGGIQFHSLPQEDFFGYGPDSSVDNHASYHRQGTDTRAWLAFTPKPWLEVRYTVGYLGTKLSSGDQPGVPSIEQVDWSTRVVGMARGSNFLHGGLEATIDRRDNPELTRSGGFYRVALDRFVPLSAQDRDFLRFNVDVRRYVPVSVLGDEDSIAVRGGLVMTDAAGSDARAAAFYFLPRLGGSSLRGYETSRFVDAHAAYFSAEYRWQVRRKLQIVGFVDAGQVASSLSNFSFGKLQHSVGAGVRYRGFRVDYAVGREGSRVHVGFGPSF